MEATAADVPHISELHALVTIDRCGFPDLFATPENEWHHKERESAPQSISIIEQAHLPRDWSLVS